MEKADILEAIRRCAEDNGGRALGKARFEAATGITEAQWSGRYWVRWSDAVSEAGYESGRMNPAFSDEMVLDALADLVRVLGHYPVVAEMAIRRRTDPHFPNAKVFQKYGNKAQVAARLIEFCGDSGAHFKIGRSNAAGRRAYELAIQLPNRLELIHAIETDDAVGIERYWHERFADRRLNGEWFKLSAADVAAFKRRKRYM